QVVAIVPDRDRVERAALAAAQSVVAADRIIEIDADLGGEDGLAQRALGHRLLRPYPLAVDAPASERQQSLPSIELRISSHCPPPSQNGISSSGFHGAVRQPRHQERTARNGRGASHRSQKRNESQWWRQRT